MTANEEQPKMNRVVAWMSRSLPGARWFNSLRIGPKLSLGLAALVGMMLLIMGVTLVASFDAIRRIGQTNASRVPIVTAVSQAQVNLLQMQANIHGYLALGRPEFRTDYNEARFRFEEFLGQLERESAQMEPINQNRLQELTQAYETWQTQPEDLFDLHDNRLAREPAYRELAIDGVLHGGQVLVQTKQLIDLQAEQELTQENVDLLKDMARFQGSFAAMFSGLRNYVNTQDRRFKQEYDANRLLNDNDWEQLVRRSVWLDEQQIPIFNTIRSNRTQFLQLTEQQVIPVLEIDGGEGARLDLARFRGELEPQTDLMLALLTTIRDDEYALMVSDLQAGSAGLQRAQLQIVVVALAAILFSAGLVPILHANIAGSITRLTRTAQRIRDGSLEEQAAVSSSDEIGILAQTFNQMTGRLRDTLRQVRKEKKRADDLLHVVIPIGIQLSFEEDFNRLLENILLEAKTFCNADAGSLYLRTDDDRLQFVIVRNDSQNLALGGTTGNEIPYDSLPLYDADGNPNDEHVTVRVTLSGESINLADVYDPDSHSFTGPQLFDSEIGYRVVSMLTIPLQGSDGEVKGVLQLLNAKEPASDQVVPFDPNLQQMMESFSSLATAALEAYIREQSLRQEIQLLRIEIDEAKLQQQVRETVETDFFQELQSKARDIRQRRRERSQGER
ncbi:MAG: HAMP domain-containing protein [Chloroflexota bacterium]